MKSLAGYALGGLFLAFGALWLLWPILHGKPHSNADTYVGAGSMLLGAVLVAPANLKTAIDALSGVLPSFGRHEEHEEHEEHEINPNSLPPAGTPKA